MAKKRSKKRKTENRAKEVSLQLEATEDDLQKFVKKEKKEFSKKMDEATREVDELLKNNAEVKKLKREIREKPLVYAALAFTAGIALGTILKGRH